MRPTRLLFSVLYVATLGAQAQQSGERVTIAAPPPMIELPEHIRYMDSAEFDFLKGDYQLANGQTLHLT